MLTRSQNVQSAIQVTHYEPALFEVLDAVPGRPLLSKLRHRSYLNWYYASSDYCHLYLVLGQNQECLACQGRELMPFSIGGRRQEVACLSSFYAFRAGFGFYAFAACMRNADVGMLLGGTDQARAFTEKAKWFIEKVEAHCLNTPRIETGGDAFRKLCQYLLDRYAQQIPLISLRRQLPDDLKQIRVEEQAGYDAGLLDFTSAFDFRFDPDLGHLAWRYSLDLPFVRYRLFKAFLGKTYLGYFILQDMPHEVLVAQADGIAPRLLAAAVIHGISAVAGTKRDKRHVILLVCHPAMRELFQSVGFRHRPRLDMPIALGSTKGRLRMSVPTSGWLFNYDWGDRGLNRPFPGEVGT